MLETSLDSFFNEKLSSYFNKNKITIPHYSQQYLIGLLKTFVSAGEIKYSTLFDIYKKCVEDQEIMDFKYLGDHSLYIAGVFPNSLNRSLVGIDYYIQMGQLGYANAANLSKNSSNRQLYQNMSGNFKTYMNSLYCIGQESLLKDKMSLYDNYLISENPEMLKDLVKLGFFPVK